MVDPYLSLDGARAILVLLLAIAQPLMGYWPQLRRWPHTTPSRSAQLQTPVVPIEWAFAIWGVIFMGCLGFAIWQLMPANLSDPLLREIGWLAIAVFLLTVAWEYYVPKYDLGWPSVGLIVATLACLLLIMVRLEAAEPYDAKTFWLLAAPFQLFAGWISAAVFVNTSSTLRRCGSEQGTTASVALIVAATVLAAIVAFASSAVIYVAAIAWALFGIVVANIVRKRNRFIALSAGAAIPLVIAVALV